MPPPPPPPADIRVAKFDASIRNYTSAFWQTEPPQGYDIYAGVQPAVAHEIGRARVQNWPNISVERLSAPYAAIVKYYVALCERAADPELWPLTIAHAASRAMTGLAHLSEFEGLHGPSHRASRGFDGTPPRPSFQVGILDAALYFELGRELLHLPVDAHGNSIGTRLWAAVSEQFQPSATAAPLPRLVEDAWLTINLALTAWAGNEFINRWTSTDPRPPHAQRVEGWLKGGACGLGAKFQAEFANLNPWQKHAYQAGVRFAYEVGGPDGAFKGWTAFASPEQSLFRFAGAALLFQAQDYSRLVEPSLRLEFLRPDFLPKFTSATEPAFGSDRIEGLPALLHWMQLSSGALAEISMPQLKRKFQELIDDLKVCTFKQSEPFIFGCSVDVSTPPALDLQYFLRTAKDTKNPRHLKIRNRLLVEHLLGDALLPECRFFQQVAAAAWETCPMGVVVLATREIFDDLRLSWHDDYKRPDHHPEMQPRGHPVGWMSFDGVLGALGCNISRKENVVLVKLLDTHAELGQPGDASAPPKAPRPPSPMAKYLLTAAFGASDTVISRQPCLLPAVGEKCRKIHAQFPVADSDTGLDYDDWMGTICSILASRPADRLDADRRAFARSFMEELRKNFPEQLELFAAKDIESWIGGAYRAAVAGLRRMPTLF